MTSVPPDDLPPPDGAPAIDLPPPEGLPAPQFRPPQFPPRQLTPPVPPQFPPPQFTSPVAPQYPPPTDAGATPDYSHLPRPPVGYRTYQPGGFSSASYAGFWRRFGGSLIDGLAVAILPAVFYGIGIAASTSSTTSCEPTYTSSGFESVCTSTPVVAPIGRTGQSVGGRIVGIRVQDSSTGRPIGLGRSIGRYLVASFVSGWCCHLGYLWMLFDDRNQTWHDKIVSSVVVTA